ncbi:hypothetical protein [Streptomyces nojiriensis]|uniref:hypothetical protein n=1 Tax=Streptomyces nojiriensis TaxID=66374 RepID=UPI003668BD29
MAGNDLGSLLGGLLGGSGGQGGSADGAGGAGIARALPTAVDRLSPEGQLPTGSLEDIIRAQKF